MTLENVNIPQKPPVINPRNLSGKVQMAERLQQLTKDGLFSGSGPQDEKANIISSRLSEDSFNPHTDIRFQANTPVARLLETLKNHNESGKIQNEKFDEDSDEYAEFSDVEEYDEEKNEGIGFYIVMNESPAKLSKLFPKNKFDLIRERIASTYHSGLFRENGTLVNLTA